MTDHLSRPCTAFEGTRRIASGSLVDVALAIKAAQGSGAESPVLAFDDSTGAVIDLDLRGTTADIVTRLAEHAELEKLAASTVRRPTPAPPPAAAASAPSRGRGRPKLGVVAREVTLLPRHWEWLAAQPGGASQALRRLVEQARRADGWHTRAKAAREASYRFLAAMAGDLPGYEETIRALFAGDDQAFAERMADWPEDIRTHALKLAGTGQTKDEK